ncbi:MAG TPA: YcxB family protein [Edaphobacter sp.]
MEVIATISFEQFKAAVVATRRHYSQQSEKPKWKGIVSIVLLTFALQTSGEYLGVSASYQIAFYLALLILGVSLFLWCKWQSKSCLRKTYEIQKKQLNGQIMNIDESGISGKWENGDATYQYKWSPFESFIDLADGFLFFPNPASFVRVPKDSLNFDEQQAIRTWAQSHRG